MFFDRREARRRMFSAVVSSELDLMRTDDGEVGSRSGSRGFLHMRRELFDHWTHDENG